MFFCHLDSYTLHTLRQLRNTVEKIKAYLMGKTCATHRHYEMDTYRTSVVRFGGNEQLERPSSKWHANNKTSHADSSEKNYVTQTNL